MSRLLTIQETAARLNLSPDHVRGLIATRAIIPNDCRKPGSSRAYYRISEEEVERYIAATRTGELAPRRQQRRKPQGDYLEIF